MRFLQSAVCALVLLLGLGCYDRSSESVAKYTEEKQSHPAQSHPDVVQLNQHVAKIVELVEHHASMVSTAATPFQHSYFVAEYQIKQPRNFRSVMGLAGQAMVNIERGLKMDSEFDRAFALQGFLLLE